MTPLLPPPDSAAHSPLQEALTAVQGSYRDLEAALRLAVSEPAAHSKAQKLIPELSICQAQEALEDQLEQFLSQEQDH